jgi:hypothetical protein
MDEPNSEEPMPALPYAEPGTQNSSFFPAFKLGQYFAVATLVLSTIFSPVEAWWIMSYWHGPGGDFFSLLMGAIAFGIIDSVYAWLIVTLSCWIRLRNSPFGLEPRMVWTLPAIHVFLLYVWRGLPPMLLEPSALSPHGSFIIFWFAGTFVSCTAIPFLSRYILLRKS